MKTIIFASLLLTSSLLYSQTYEAEDFMMSSAGEMYSVNYLNGESNGRGNTGIGGTQNISGTLLNPAALRISSGNQVAFQYSYKSVQEWEVNSTLIGSYTYKTKPVTPSAFIAYGRKLNKFVSAGFIYSNALGQKTDLSGTPFSMDDYDQYYEYNVHSFWIPFSYNMGMLSAGINLNFSYHRNFIHGATTLQSPDTRIDVVSSFSRFNVQGGLLFTPAEQFSAGVTFTPGFKAYPESDEMQVSSNIKVVSKFPMRIGAGIKYTPVKNKLNLYFDYNFVQTSDLVGYKDRHDFNFGGDLMVNKNLTFRAGAFTFFDNRDFLDQTIITYAHAQGEYEQIFLTIGGTAKFKNLEVTGSVMDSHISSGFVKVTHINLGGVVNF